MEYLLIISITIIFIYLIWNEMALQNLVLSKTIYKLLGEIIYIYLKFH